MPPRVLVLLLIVTVTLFRLCFYTRLDLVGDEAYYWLLSRHLDMSYFSKGPRVALTIALGTHLFGDTVFGIPFFSVFLSAATSFDLYELAAMLFDAQVAFRTVLMAVTVPMLAVGSVLMTIDPISVFFWTIAALTFWKGVGGQCKMAWWTFTGIMIGFGTLGKYTNFLELVCFMVFCCWEPTVHRQFLKLGIYMMVLSAFVVTLPIWISNVQHSWISFHHVVQRGNLDSAWQFRPLELISFLGVQATVISPLISLGILTVVFSPSLWRSKQLQTRYLLSLFLPIFLIYCIASLNKAGEPNWTAPC